MTNNYFVTANNNFALYWYDRSLRLWVVTQRDNSGNQIGSALYAPTKKLAEQDAQKIVLDGVDNIG
jgi:hypothetical protein